MPESMRFLLSLAILIPLVAPLGAPQASSCHPDVALPGPFNATLPGGYMVSASVNFTNGGCSHQPQASACVALSQGNQTLWSRCALLA